MKYSRVCTDLDGNAIKIHFFVRLFYKTLIYPMIGIAWVHNDNYMDERVKTLVFHRSFSTKGEGRGIGTYSMKLFGEKFLKGQVNFISKQEEGTTFYIKIPLLVGN